MSVGYEVLYITSWQPKLQTSGRTEPQITGNIQTLVEDELKCSVHVS